jgi:hypothetical protein
MCTGWSKCPIAKYSGLSDDTCIDLVLTGSYVTVLYWAGQLIGVYVCRFRFVGLLFYVFWSLRSWKVSGVGDEGWSYTTTGDVQTLLEAFLNMFLRSACSIDEVHIGNPTRCNNVSKSSFIFIWSSTCFGQHTAHHQEPKTALAASGFAYMEGCWTCSCLTLTVSSNWTSNNPPRMQNQRLLVQF